MAVGYKVYFLPPPQAKDDYEADFAMISPQYVHQVWENSSLTAAKERATIVNNVGASGSASQIVFGSIVSSLKDEIQVNKTIEDTHMDTTKGKEKVGSAFVPFVVGGSSSAPIAIVEIEDDEVTNT